MKKNKSPNLRNKKVLVVLGILLLLGLSFGTYYILNNQNIASEDASAGTVLTRELNGITLTLQQRYKNDNDAERYWYYKVSGKIKSCYQGIDVNANVNSTDKRKVNITVKMKNDNCISNSRGMISVSQEGTFLASKDLVDTFEVIYDGIPLKGNPKYIDAEGFRLYIEDSKTVTSSNSSAKLAASSWNYSITGQTHFCNIPTVSIDKNTGQHTLLLTRSNEVACKDALKMRNIRFFNKVLNAYVTEKSFTVKFTTTSNNLD